MGDLSGMAAVVMIVCGLIGAAAMALLFWGVPWAWELIRPWLHAVTG